MNFAVTSQIHCQMVFMIHLLKKTIQDPNSTKPALSFCSLGVPHLFLSTEGKQ